MFFNIAICNGRFKYLDNIQLCHKMISAPPTTHGISCTVYGIVIEAIFGHWRSLLSASISGRNAKGETLTSVLTSES